MIYNIINFIFNMSVKYLPERERGKCQGLDDVSLALVAFDRMRENIRET